MATLNKNLMKFPLFSLTFILILLLTACSSPTPTSIPFATEIPSPTPQPLTGVWMGAVTKPDGSSASIQLTFNESNAVLSIEPFTKTWQLDVTRANGEIQFLLMGNKIDPFTQINFLGSLANNVLSGDITWDGQQTFITFVPIVSVNPSLLESYEGLYRFESGRAFSIIVSPEYSSGGLYFFSQSLMLTDFESGALRGLYAFSENNFGIGVLRVAGAPFDGRVEFIKDAQGNISGLMWWDEFDGVTPSASSGQFATRISFTFEDVTYESADGTVLSGRFNLPEAGDPLAAFVMLHGSEAGTKDNFGQQLMSHYMMSRGIAILNTDKRGVGDSGGNYVEAPSTRNINNLAADAIAGVEYLLTRPEIDATRIGLIGGSQSGWIIPVAASESENVSFFVIISGPVISAGQEDRYSTVTNDGDTAVTYDAEKLNQTLREMEPSGVDPIPVLAELTQPGLWLWGSVDKNVPATVSAENLQVLIDGGKNNFSYVMLPSGDHNLNESPHGYFAEIPYSPRVLYYSALTRWLEENNISPKE